jgi:hypothetical protein
VSVFARLTLHASDPAASRRFNRTLLGPLGGPRPDLAVAAGGSVTRGLHLGLAAASPALVDACWRAGVEAGYASDGAPGPRPEYRADYYGAFLLDPDGNSAEAVHHGALREDGIVDHLWIRVADLDASRRFYDEVAALARFAAGRPIAPAGDLPARVFYAGRPRGSFSLVGGVPAEGVHLAFPGPARRLADPDGNVVELV